MSKGQRAMPNGKTSPPKPLKKVSRQQGLPGIAPAPSHPDILKAADKYVIDRDARMDATEDETTSRDALIVVMKKHKLTKYKDPDTGIEVEIDERTKVKVRRAKEPS